MANINVYMNGEDKEISEEALDAIIADVMKQFDEIAAKKGLAEVYKAYLDRSSHNGYNMIDVDEYIAEEIENGGYDDYFAPDAIEEGFDDMLWGIDREAFFEELRKYPYSRSNGGALADDIFTRFESGEEWVAYIRELCNN